MCLGRLEAFIGDSLGPCPAMITVRARTRLAINDFVYKITFVTTSLSFRAPIKIIPKVHLLEDYFNSTMTISNENHVP